MRQLGTLLRCNGKVGAFGGVRLVKWQQVALVSVRDQLLADFDTIELLLLSHSSCIDRVVLSPQYAMSKSCKDGRP